ncbi:hypothetical protein FA13DRAFT_1724246 [Coprinellus micaceus]|uniref:Uncharacterized protein n=1 Tax=Coprinellus micaceus TaxID=71717 RepID=A0A4Y7U0R0_COPMI|nr:hypothetical protein FA13DRAFT_1724246 [Coprinellus micaceus]
MSKTPETYEEVERILSVSSVAKDLDIPKWEEWAVHTAGLAANDDVFLDSCSSMILRLVIQVASSATPPVLPIVARVAARWSERVRNKKAPSVPAIMAAEAYTTVRSNAYVPEVRALCGIAYYLQLQDMDDCQTFEKDGIVTKVRTDRKLTNEQAFKLLTGHYSLVRFWQSFRLNPSKIPLDDQCSKDRHVRCNTVWTKRWTSAVGWKRIMTLNEADALGLIACLKSQLGEDDELKAGMAPGCRLAGLEMLEKKRDEVDANLMSHFLGCI